MYQEDFLEPIRSLPIKETGVIKEISEIFKNKQ